MQVALPDNVSRIKGQARVDPENVSDIIPEVFLPMSTKTT